ncbi:MAG: hypothetical protein U5L75_00505 [Candidatus Campbellbacteria bacterium]|nr:hypothetical protein [Candidatus Campbellbacteria bacterium]
MKTKILLIASLVILIGVIVLFSTRQEEQKYKPEDNNNDIEEITFEETGNLVRNNPGMKEGVWYMVYESPGSPASTQELLFTDRSECVTPEGSEVCDAESFSNGYRVKIEGIEKAGVVEVSRLYPK